MKPDLLTISELPEYDDHHFVSCIMDKSVNLTAYIAIHRGGLKQPAFGATRIWKYASDADALRDALKLSKIMTYKSALAGLHHGGAKAVIVNKSDKISRTALLKSYAQHVNYLGGHFITGADVGVNNADLAIMARYSPYMVGVHYEVVDLTMLGVFYGIQVSCKEIFGTSDIRERTFAIQGLGKTGTGLLKFLYGKAKKIYVTDINDRAIETVKHSFPDVEPVRPDAIISERVDIFSPCALSSVLNHTSIHSIHARIIAGSANSQLESEKVGNELYKMGILYAPDYVINAGGLMAVVDEFEQKRPDVDRVKRKVATIKKTLTSIIEKSKRSHKSTNVVADALAQEISQTFV